MLPPKPLRFATLKRGEKHLYSAKIRLGTWEKKVWPFKGYRPSVGFGGLPGTAHWTSRRLIIEPEEVHLLERVLTAAMAHFIEAWNPLVGMHVSAQAEFAQELASTAHEHGIFLAIPHTALEKYQPCFLYAQAVPLESVNDAETLCFLAWEFDSSTPRVDEVIELGNRLIAESGG
ncbi:MAG TPA: hypothetical protein VHQ90_10890 [Thermoanaerobaculia bacterium]|nr:hypothetical protein [Thermoanaerobaculia bacterium]